MTAAAMSTVAGSERFATAALERENRADEDEDDADQHLGGPHPRIVAMPWAAAALR